MYTELSNSDLDFAKLLQSIETEHEEEDDLHKDGSILDTRSSSEITFYEDDDDIPYIDGFTANGSPYRALKRQRPESAASTVSSYASSQECVADRIEAEKQAEGIPWHAFSSYFLAGNNCCGICDIFLYYVLVYSFD